MSHRPTDHEETIEHLRDIAGAIRDTAPKPIAEPCPALDFTAPRIASAADRDRLHGLAVLLVDRTTDLLRSLRTNTMTPDALTAISTATTAATTALLACSTDDAKGGA
jgi:hypothetical protein